MIASIIILNLVYVAAPGICITVAVYHPVCIYFSLKTCMMDCASSICIGVTYLIDRLMPDGKKTPLI